MANYPVPYQNNWNYSGIGQQMYPQYQQSMGQMQIPQAQTSEHGLRWVDGEIGARAYQMPAGLKANEPIALWDTNDTVIYLKSVNPMGMPNPLQKVHYKLESGKSGEMTQVSGNVSEAVPMDEYVKKDDMERMKQELMDAIKSVNTGAKGDG